MAMKAVGDLPRNSAEALIIYLNAAQVRTRYGGISDMALWRWLRDKDLQFPQPIRINGRRFWKASDLHAWERRRAPAGESA